MTDQAPTAVTDAELEEARDHWTDDDWAKHFRSIRVEPSPVRYRGRDDIVLRYAIRKIHGPKCWWALTSDCDSAALLLSRAQIDHVVPKTAEGSALRQALAASLFQKGRFDVHDPGNLALICPSCNHAKRDGVARKLTPGIRASIHDVEERRQKVINAWTKYQQLEALDDASVSVLREYDISDPHVRDIYAEVIARMITNLAGDELDFSDPGTLVSVQTEVYGFRLEMSDELSFALDGLVDARIEEMKIERAERANRA
jgi:5-methylcytosine-specific restriction endonuclease McrA